MNRISHLFFCLCLATGLFSTTVLGAELLKNQNFKYSLANWMFHIHKDVRAERSVSKGILNLNITTAGRSAHVQLMQRVNLEKGMPYKLSFEARRDSEKEVPTQVYCMQRKKPYRNCGLSQTVQFSQTWSRHEMTFTAKHITANNQPTIRLFLGNQTGLVQLRNFSLVPVLALKQATQTDKGQALAPPQWEGIYALTNKAYPVEVDGQGVDLLNTPGSAGVTYYHTWRKCEPTKGQWDLSNFEDWFAAALKANRKLNIALLAGSHVPDWALEESQSPPYLYLHVKTNSTRRNYLPWTIKDGERVLNEPMLQIWRQSIEQFSQQIRKKPGFEKTLGYIAITGGPYSNGLEIMWGVNKMADGSTFAWGPQEDQFLIAYWQRCVDIFMDIFPDIPLGLAFTDVYGRNANGSPRRNIAVPKAIMNYAVQQAKLKNVQLIAQGFWIGAGAGDSHWGKKHPDQLLQRSNTHDYPMLRETHPLQKTLLSYRPNTTIAYQGPMGTSTKDYLTHMIQFARERGALFLELWHHDFANPEYRAILQENAVKP